MKTDPIDILRRGNPIQRTPDGTIDEHAEADLRRLLAAPRSASTVTSLAPRPRTTRRVVLAGAVAATVAAAAAIVVVDPFGTSPVAVAAATPPLMTDALKFGVPARQQLLALANLAGHDTSLPGDTARSYAVRTDSWSLSTSVDGRTVTSAIIPTQTQITWNQGQSGRIIVKTGEPWFPNGDYRRTWLDDGSPGKPGTVVRDESWAPSPYATGVQKLAPPINPAELAAALAVGHPVAYGTPGLMVGLNDLHGSYRPTPAIREALLRLLADRPDIRSLGTMTDRAGRAGLGFYVDSTHGGLPNRRIMVFAPKTGALMATEEVLTKDPGRLNVAIPAVLSYTLYYPAG